MHIDFDFELPYPNAVVHIHTHLIVFALNLIDEANSRMSSAYKKILKDTWPT